jgi:hypothetical protein
MDENINLGRIEVKRKSGTEKFHKRGIPLEFDLSSFWQWSASDIVSNATRGVLAEYIVARALGIGINDIRHEWDAFDLQLPSGLKIEVKSASYLQSWAQKKYSNISFGVKARLHWDYETNKQSELAERPADVYIFALLHHKDKATIDPLDVSQWSFFVLETEVINSRKRSQHSITLGSLEKITSPVSYSDLAGVIAQVDNKLQIK